MESKDGFKKYVESMSMLIPPLDPPPNCERHRLSSFFFCNFFSSYWGCLVRCETDFVKFLVTFDKNNAKEGHPKFDKLKVRGFISMVK